MRDYSDEMIAAAKADAARPDVNPVACISDLPEASDEIVPQTPFTPRKQRRTSAVHDTGE
jgi:hypothetical protein